MTGRKYFLAALGVAAVTAVFMPGAAQATNAPPANPGMALHNALDDKNYNKGPAQPGLGAPVSPEMRGSRPGGPTDNSVLKGQDQTLTAPFTDIPRDAAPKNQVEELVPYIGPTAQGEGAGLDAPHRSQKEVADFLVKALTEILSMGNSASDRNKPPWVYEEHLKKLAIGLDVNALSDFQAFMTQSNILQTLQDNNKILRIYIEASPVLLAKGKGEDGRYHWLYEMPVTLSFLDPSAKTYENQPGAFNRRVVIRMQVGHVPKKVKKDDPGIDEMMIETFKVTENTEKH